MTFEDGAVTQFAVRPVRALLLVTLFAATMLVAGFGSGVWSGVARADPTCTDTWVGSSAGDWATASNWSTGVVPDASDIACVEDTGTTVTVNSDDVAATVLDVGTLDITAGSLTVSGTGTDASVVAALNLSGGSLLGGGELDVSGSLDWSNGTMAGSGSTVLGSSVSGTIDGPAAPGFESPVPTLDGRTLVNHGSLALSSGVLIGNDGATLINTGTLAVNSEDTIYMGSISPSALVYNGVGSEPLLINTSTGTIEKTSGTGQSEIAFAIDNEGSVHAGTGQLMLWGGDPSGSGVADSTFPSDGEAGGWSAASGASIAFGTSYLSSGAFKLGSGVSMSGDIDINGATVSAGSVTGSADLSISSGSFALTDTGSASSVGSLTLSGGSLLGGGELDVSGSLDWSNGTMAGSGSTVLGSSVSGTIDGPAAPGFESPVPTLDGRTLVNHGSLALSSGVLIGNDGATLINTGTLAVNSEDTIYMGSISPSALVYNGVGSEPLLINTSTGTIEKTSGTGQSEIAFAIDNEGSVHAGTGQLMLWGGDPSGSGVADSTFPSDGEAGGWSAASGASIAFGTSYLSSGAFKLGSGVSMSGDIDINGATVSAGSVTGSADLSISSGSFALTDTGSASSVGSLTLSGGSLLGGGELDVSGSLDWSNGTMAGSGSTVLGSSVSGTIDGPAAPGFESPVPTLDGRTLVNHGSLALSSGVLIGNDGATLINTGTLAAMNDRSAKPPTPS